MQHSWLNRNTTFYSNKQSLFVIKSNVQPYFYKMCLDDNVKIFMRQIKELINGNYASLLQAQIESESVSCSAAPDSLQTIACQAPLPMEFPRWKYWSGLPSHTPGNIPDQGLDPGHLHCKQILHRLNHWGSPSTDFWTLNTANLIIK